MLLMGDPIAVTMESGEYMIPTGVYMLHRYSSEQYPDTWEVLSVPRRDKILFHVGNWYYNSTGCILVAKSFGDLLDQKSINDSEAGFRVFMDRTREYKNMMLVIE